MIKPIEFTQTQRKITRAICVKQLDSLRRLLHDESETDIDITMFLIENEVTKSEFKEKLESNIRKFKKLVKDPDDFRVLEKSDLSKFRHILTNLEDDYKKDYPRAISNLWRRLFLIEHVMETDFNFEQLN